MQAGGTARAQLSARDILVDGCRQGTSVAEELLALGETASFAGEVRAGRLRMDEGAVINATITMTPAGDAPPARRMDDHDEEHSVDVTGSAMNGEGDHGAYGSRERGLRARCVRRRAHRGDVRRLLGCGLRRG